LQSQIESQRAPKRKKSEDPCKYLFEDRTAYSFICGKGEKGNRTFFLETGRP